MKCPHCLIAFHDKWTAFPIQTDVDGSWMLSHTTCPDCKRLIIRLVNGAGVADPRTGALISLLVAHKELQVYPRGSGRSPCPNEIPNQISEDYKEACLVLPDSPKASAALSRRCLQNVLRESANVKHGDLYDEIQQVLDSGKLPAQIADGLDAVRAIGNFGAHPIKSKHTGEVMPVAVGEAEWNLDILESLFDFYYVQPALLAAKKAALNKKMQEAGKKPVR
jgi:Domain of unknown function (DUF4145)